MSASRHQMFDRPQLRVETVRQGVFEEREIGCPKNAEPSADGQECDREYGNEYWKSQGCPKMSYHYIIDEITVPLPVTSLPIAPPRGPRTVAVITTTISPAIVDDMVTVSARFARPIACSEMVRIAA